MIETEIARVLSGATGQYVSPTVTSFGELEPTGGLPGVALIAAVGIDVGVKIVGHHMAKTASTKMTTVRSTFSTTVGKC